jgi:hypothetical protein
MIPRCDQCAQPLIGTALCGVCAQEYEALMAERHNEWWTE